MDATPYIEAAFRQGWRHGLILGLVMGAALGGYFVWAWITIRNLPGFRAGEKRGP